MGGCDTLSPERHRLHARTGGNMGWTEARDLWLHELTAGSAERPAQPEWVEAEHPLFLLYTSGSTGKPKGVQHSTGGYLLHAALTMKWTFDLSSRRHLLVHRRHRLGHGPHLRGLRPAGQWAARKSSSRASRPTRTPAASGSMIEKHKVTIFYTAPTAIRALIKAAEGNAEVHPAPATTSVVACACWARSASRSTPRPGMWYHRNVSAASAAPSSTPSGRPRPAAT